MAPDRDEHSVSFYKEAKEAKFYSRAKVRSGWASQNEFWSRGRHGHAGVNDGQGSHRGDYGVVEARDGVLG